jgi:hypothetical protein
MYLMSQFSFVSFPILSYWGVCFIWQDSYAKLEFAMSEMECGSITLKEKLAESEKSITILGQEKETAVHNMEKLAQELKLGLEKQRVTVGELEALQSVHLSLVLISSEAEITSLLLLVAVTDHPHIVWSFTRMKS